MKAAGGGIRAAFSEWVQGFTCQNRERDLVENADAGATAVLNQNLGRGMGGPGDHHFITIPNHQVSKKVSVACFLPRVSQPRFLSVPRIKETVQAVLPQTGT